MFIRSEEYMNKIFCDALEKHGKVIQDADILITYVGKKAKAYCENTETYVQFPRDIRNKYRRFKADIIFADVKDYKPYVRAYKGSIRPIVNGIERDVIA